MTGMGGGNNEDFDGPRGDGNRESAALRLKNALLAVNPGRAIQRDERRQIEDAAAALVIQLRSESLPPEQMLLRIKDILGEAGVHSHANPEEPARDSALYRDVIAWVIRE